MTYFNNNFYKMENILLAHSSYLSGNGEQASIILKNFRAARAAEGEELLGGLPARLPTRGTYWRRRRANWQHARDFWQALRKEEGKANLRASGNAFTTLATHGRELTLPRLPAASLCPEHLPEAAFEGYRLCRFAGAARALRGCGCA